MWKCRATSSNGAAPSANRCTTYSRTEVDEIVFAGRRTHDLATGAFEQRLEGPALGEDAGISVRGSGQKSERYNLLIGTSVMLGSILRYPRLSMIQGWSRYGGNSSAAVLGTKRAASST